jgi:outer membrane protein assembly factor BamE
MRFLLLALTLLLASCGEFALTPHKIEIRQGNLVTPEMRQKLQIGMSKPQVRMVLGTPMLVDPYHNDRWDYVYRLETSGQLVDSRHLTLYFEGENLARIVDDTPQEKK